MPSPPAPRSPLPAPAPQALLVKLGGALLADAAALATVWAGVREHLGAGDEVVVVHGGGPQQTELARRLGHEPRIVAGRRVTGDLDLRIALWALRGELGARLVASAEAHGVRAAGLSGADGGLVRVVRRPPVDVDGEVVDFGHVGDVVGVDVSLLRVLLGAGLVPVVATVCSDGAGGLYNVNADTVAMELAAALGAARLVLVTEAGGVRHDPADAASVVARIDAAEARAGIAAGWIGGGMRPKVSVALDALARGVPAVRICGPGDVRDPAAGTTVGG